MSVSPRSVSRDHSRTQRCGLHVAQRARSSAAFTVFAISIAIVSGPTPPGTGVSAPAVAATSGCTSPTSTEPRLLEHLEPLGVAREDPLRVFGPTSRC